MSHGLQLATPVANPYCSCRLTRVAVPGCRAGPDGLKSWLDRLSDTKNEEIVHQLCKDLLKDPYGVFLVTKHPHA